MNSKQGRELRLRSRGCAGFMKRVNPRSQKPISGTAVECGFYATVKHIVESASVMRM